MSDGFNPKCNQSTGSGALPKGVPSCAEMAEQAMKRHAAYRADQKAYEEAKARSKQMKPAKPVRWLKPAEIAR